MSLSKFLQGGRSPWYVWQSSLQPQLRSGRDRPAPAGEGTVGGVTTAAGSPPPLPRPPSLHPSCSQLGGPPLGGRRGALHKGAELSPGVGCAPPKQSLCVRDTDWGVRTSHGHHQRGCGKRTAGWETSCLAAPHSQLGGEVHQGEEGALLTTASDFLA